MDDYTEQHSAPKRTGCFRWMVRLVVFGLGIIGLLVLLFAFCARGATNITVNVSSRALSSYVFAETGERLHRDPVLQSEIAIDFPLGFYASIWHSTGFDTHFSEDGGDELDYYVGWAGELIGLELDAGASYFDAVDLFRASGDTVYLYAEVGKTCGPVKPFLRGNFYLQPPGSDLEGGMTVAGGLEFEPTLPYERLSVPLRGWIAHDDGTFGGGPGLISRVEAEATWELGEQWSLFLPTASVNIPLTVNDSRRTEWVFGGGIGLSF